MNTVRGDVSVMWAEYFAENVLDMESDTTVGRRVIAYLLLAQTLLKLSDEVDVLQRIVGAAVDQVNVWVNG